MNILTFSPKKGAVIIKKVLESAIANAEHNDGADIDELKVKTIYVDKATTLKRFTARAKGRGNQIGKQSCHIRVVVGGLTNAGAFLPAMAQSAPELQGHVDGVGIHPYGTPAVVVSRVRGARAALVTTAGFEDVIQIGRQNRERLYEPALAFL